VSLIFDDRFFTNDSRSTNYHQLKPIITEWSEKITIKLREMIIELHHPKAGT
jgi:crotonobetainyl-CoA:carnitine CoA-transferase CaiB-like acyl-CoA transferase